MSAPTPEALARAHQIVQRWHTRSDIDVDAIALALTKPAQEIAGLRAQRDALLTQKQEHVAKIQALRDRVREIERAVCEQAVSALMMIQDHLNYEGSSAQHRQLKLTAARIEYFRARATAQP